MNEPRSRKRIHPGQRLSGRCFAFPWIVAPSLPKAPVAMLAANNTWNVYTRFGAHSSSIHDPVTVEDHTVIITLRETSPRRSEQRLRISPCRI